MPRYLLILVLVLSVGATAAQAQRENKGKKWELSLFYGFTKRSENLFATPFTVTTGATTKTELRDVGLNLAPGYLVGARITENMGNYFGAELEYNMTNRPLEFTNLTSTSARVAVQHRVHSVDYAILFYGLDRRHKLRPYGVVGPGFSYYETYGDSVARAIAGGVPIKDRWQVGGIVGAGVKYQTTEQTGVRFDFRDNFTGVPGYGLPNVGVVPASGPETAALLPDGLLHNWQFSVGFFYSFNGH